jgi:hypothetical protein
MLERAFRDRRLGSAAALAFVLLVFLVALHPLADEFVEEAELICAVIIPVGVAILPRVGTKPRPLQSTTRRRRPSLVALPGPAVSPLGGSGSFPLRR